MSISRSIRTGALCTLALPLFGQINDWNAVQGLETGRRVSVVTRASGRRSCRIADVSDSALVCSNRRTFPRPDVQEVRAEELQPNKAILGIVVGAAAGGILLFLSSRNSSDAETRVYTPVFGVIIGGALGAAVGHHIHRHGPVIYRQP
jgi:hypothetical protein